MNNTDTSNYDYSNVRYCTGLWSINDLKKLIHVKLLYSPKKPVMLDTRTTTNN